MKAIERARLLVLEHGWNATAYQILNPGMGYWFSAGAAGVVGYVERGGTWVVAGAPVCSPEALGKVTAEFEKRAREEGKRVCYMAAAERLEKHLRGSKGHAKIALGAQPVWDPREWEGTLRARASLRGQLARARNKGVTVSGRAGEAARHDAGLWKCLEGWLRTRPGPPMHFLVEPRALAGELADRVVLVAERGGGPVGFLMASPIPRRGGYLIEQVIRSPEAPNGTAELMIDALMRRLAASGSTYVTMGLVALTRNAAEWMRENPLWVRVMLAWVKAHGRRFYHFDGLEQFREKMRPIYWEPIYAISNEARFSPGSMHAMVAAMTEGPMAVMVAKTLVRAVATELRRLGVGIFGERDGK